MPTAEIDLVVHLIQPMSEFESNYDSGADRQAITFFVLSFFFPEVVLVRRPCKHWNVISGSVVL